MLARTGLARSNSLFSDVDYAVLFFLFIFACSVVAHNAGLSHGRTKQWPPSIRGGPDVSRVQKDKPHVLVGVSRGES